MNTASSIVESLQTSRSCLAPIGVFDSGVGGLSVAQEIYQYLPNENIIYLADTAHVPYGNKTDSEIQQLTAHAVDWLYQRGCKLAIVACNTASAFSLDFLRRKYGEAFPIIGLVPALKPALINTQTKKVAVLATPATFRGRLMQEVIQNFAIPQGVEVLTVTCLDLVPIVESGQHNSLQTQQLLHRLLMPTVERGADFLVLGCTHYPFLRASIEQAIRGRMTTIDSGQAVARQVGRVLAYHQLNAPHIVTVQSNITCYFTGGVSVQTDTLLKQLLSTQVVWNIAEYMAS